MTQQVIGLLPEIWLIVLIIVLPQLSETVYTPALPDIAKSLKTSHALVEYTLTIFLFGLAIGTLFWGKLSDKYGRKPALIAGLLIYFLGCIGCYFSTTISFLMWSRFVQAFGGSAGSVIGQVICRDAFFGSERGRVFSIIASGLATAPALGPVIGGVIDQKFGWPAIFLFLIGFGFFTLLIILWRLPETYQPTAFSMTTIKNTMIKMIFDVRVLGFGFLIGLCNGIKFSYFAEASFCLIKVLGLSPSTYGASFIILAVATVIGSYISKKMNEKEIFAFLIIEKGAKVMLFGASVYVAGMVIFNYLSTPSLPFIVLIVGSVACMMAGIGMMIPNILSIALLDYQAVMGTASSLLGFYYYCLISLFTLIMGLLHNHTLWPMPIYFLILAIVLNLICYVLKPTETKRNIL